VNASTPGTILGALGLAGVALLYLKVDRLESQMTPRSVERTERMRGAAESRMGAEEGDPLLEARAGMPEDGSSERGPRTRFHAARPGSPEASDAEAPDVASRVRELEEEVSRLRSERDAGPVRYAPRMPRMAGSVEDLASKLQLSPTQTDRVRETLDRHRQRIEDVLRIPDGSGVSPWDRRQEEQKRMREAVKSGGSGILQVAMGSLVDRNRQIPGRSTTYGEEIDRIKQEARTEIDGELDPGQKKSFEDLRIDPLLDQGTGSTFVSIRMDAATPAPEGETRDSSGSDSGDH